VKAPFFNPMMPVGVPAARSAGKTANLGGDNNFAMFMHRRLIAESGQRDLLGVTDSVSDSNAADEPKKKTASAGEDDISGIFELIQEFMQKLQALSTDTKNGPGEWSFSPADAGLLRKLAADAGMTKADLAGLLDRLAQEKKLSLGDLFGTLSRHLGNLAQSTPVTAPETDLPLLESILSRLGVPTEQLQQIADKSVVIDGTIDLEKFLQALNNLPKDEIGSSVSLTNAEVDQLQAILAAAGVTRELQYSLLPERGLSWDHPFQPERPVHMNLGRLKSMLEHAISQVKAGRPKLDLPAFFADLDQVLSQSGFIKNGSSWSPAVQQSVKAMYDQLLANVDLENVHIETPSTKPKLALSEAGIEGKQQGKGGPFAMNGDPDSHLAAVPETAQGSGKGQGELKQLAELVEAAGKRLKDGESQSGIESFAMAASRSVAGGSHAAASKTLPSLPRLAPDVWQQALNQLTSGVSQALHDNEHHFVLRLHPQELGEVKVEVLVRDHQISLAFTMDDKRVKEMLENNIGQFHDNLEKQGFIVGECIVSMDQQKDSGETRQWFVSSGKEQGKDRLVEGVGGNPQELLTRILSHPGRENGFNIVI
jgi:flagellar hook-length control protein FliK